MRGTVTRVGIDPWALLDGWTQSFARDGLEKALQRGYHVPPVNLWSSDEGAIVEVELPGVDPDKVEVSVENHVLTLRGEVAGESVKDDAVIHRQERFAGRFERTVELPFDIDAVNTKATAKNGVLRITLPKSAGARTKRIPVEVV